MKAIHEVNETALEWKWLSGDKRERILVAGDDIVARLVFPNKIGSLATGETADVSWSFKRVGFLNPGITVRVKDSETDLALFKPVGLFGDGALEFADGRKFKWATDKPQSGAWTVSSDAGTPLLRLGAETWVPNRAIQLTIEPAARELPELPLLVLMAEYFLLMLHLQQIAGVAGVFAAISA